MQSHGPLREALSRKERLVVCLCAAWCDTCEEFRQAFARLADADREAAYLWIDIEDESELLGDIDIENFPTLAVFLRGVPIFYGVTLPHEPVVARTVAALSAAARPQDSVPEAIRALPGVLKSRGMAK